MIKNQPKVIMLRGLPGSGKTTRAFDILAQAKTPMIRVNRDDMRSMLFNSRWTKENEKFVMAQQQNIAKAALKQEASVIIDDTNLSTFHFDLWHNIAKEFNAEFELVDLLDIPLQVCLDRNAKRIGKNRILEEIIYEMAEKAKGINK